MGQPLGRFVTARKVWSMLCLSALTWVASALQSTLFEYTVEGFIQRPSGVDLLVTPLVGVPVGERLGKWILPVSLSFILVKYLFRSPL